MSAAMHGRAGDARITPRTTPGASRRLQEAGPPVGALRLRPGRVGDHRLVDPGGHAAHLRQEHPEVDTGLLETGELAGRHRPVRALHQSGQDVVADDAAQLVSRPARHHPLRHLAEFLLLARDPFLGGGVVDGRHEPVGHRGGLRGLVVGGRSPVMPAASRSRTPASAAAFACARKACARCHSAAASTASTSAISRVRTTAAPPPRAARGARSRARVDGRQPARARAPEGSGGLLEDVGRPLDAVAHQCRGSGGCP